MNKIAILDSGLVNKGGVERLILTISGYFDVDIYTGIYNQETIFEEFKKLNVIQLIKKVHIPRTKFLSIKYNFSKLRLKDYDCYMFFDGGSIIAAKNHHPNVWYCSAPTRWLYDLYPDELKRRGFIKRQIFRVICHFLRRDDQRNVKGVDKILVNSKNVQQRVREIYGRESAVVYPPVNIEKFKFKELGDYYLSTGRLDPIKRVDLVVKAFQKMPDKKLVIASGGPDLEKIKSMAGGYNNIEVLGWVSEEKLIELYGGCIANIYTSYKEDFGMIPVESMAAGKPCIGSNDGGMKETIVHEKTGLLIDPSVETVIKAVEWMTPERAREMRDDCEKRAGEFSEEKFVRGIESNIEGVIAKS